MLAQAVVRDKLLEPLKEREERKSLFTRAYLPPQHRRVRILDAQLLRDEEGGAFLTFAVDARHGSALMDEDEAPEKEWRKATITGCVYPDTKEVFVKRKDSYRPAAFMLGKKVKVAAKHICHSETTQVASAK